MTHDSLRRNPTYRPSSFLLNHREIFHRRKVHPPLKDLGLAILLLKLNSPSTVFVLVSIPCLVLALASRDASRRGSGRGERLARLARILAEQTQDE